MPGPGDASVDADARQSFGGLGRDHSIVDQVRIGEHVADHVVVGPAGVLVVVEVAAAGAVQPYAGELWAGGRSLAPERQQAETLAAALAAELLEPCTPVLALPPECLATPLLEVGPTLAVDVGAFATIVAALPVRYEGKALATLARCVGAALDVPVPVPQPRRARPVRARGVSAMSLFEGRPSKRAKRANNARILVAGAGMLAAVLFVPKAVESAKRHQPSVSAEPTCAAPGKGWTLTLRWPGDRQDLYGYRLAVSRDSATTWQQLDTWQPGGARPVIEGVAPGTPIVVMATAVSTSQAVLGQTTDVVAPPDRPC